MQHDALDIGGNCRGGMGDCRGAMAGRLAVRQGPIRGDGMEGEVVQDGTDRMKRL